MIRSSDSLASFAPAFVAAQAEMPNVLKASTGQVGQQKTRYADLTDIVDAIRPVLEKHHLAFFQGCSDGDKIVTVTTRIIHESGEWIEDCLSVPAGNNGAQGVGSAITYARRYSLSAALGVVTDEDDDGKAASAAPKATRAPQKGTVKPKDDGEVQLLKRQMFALMRDCGYLEREERLKVAAQIVKRDINTSDDLSVADLRKVNAVLQEMFDHQPADGERVPE